MGINCSSGRSHGAVIHDIRDALNYKILLLGDSAVGKTSVFRKFVENTFDPVYKPTTRPLVKNVFQKVNVPEDYVISVSLWDVPIKEDIDMRESYYRNVDAVIVVVDMTDKTSIRLSGTWKQNFVNSASKTFTVTEVLPNGHRTTTVKKTLFNPYEVPFLLLGNKYDQIEDQIKEKRLQKSIQDPVLDGLDASTIAESSSNPLIPDGIIEQKDLSDSSTIKKKYYTEDGKQAEDQDQLECVSLLKESEVEHDFIGSMLVSAKLSDGSVDLAFQSLLRHLLKKSGPEKMKNEQEQSGTPHPTNKMKRQDRDKYLMYCGIEQLDSIFSKCYVPVKRADDIDNYYNMIMARLQQTCLNNGFIKMIRASLEDCITGMNEALYQGYQQTLKVKDQGEFIRLYYSEECLADIPESVESSLNIFNNEYASICETILKECPQLDIMFVRLDTLLEKLAEELKRRYGDRAKTYVDICIQNQARVVFARKQASRCLREVNNVQQKVNAALIW